MASKGTFIPYKEYLLPKSIQKYISDEYRSKALLQRLNNTLRAMQYDVKQLSNISKQPTPPTPPTPEEERDIKPRKKTRDVPKKDPGPGKDKQKELDRVLREHGFTPGKDFLYSKRDKEPYKSVEDFYSQFIGKTPEEVSKVVIEAIKNDKHSQINADVIQALKDAKEMYAPIEGKEPMTGVAKGLRKGNFPYDIVPASHMRLILDASLIKDEKGNPVPLPAKQDLSKYGTAGLVIFAVQQMYAKENMNDMITPGFNPTANAFIDNVIEAYAEKETSFNKDILKEIEDKEIAGEELTAEEQEIKAIIEKEEKDSKKKVYKDKSAKNIINKQKRDLAKEDTEAESDSETAKIDREKEIAKGDTTLTADEVDAKKKDLKKSFQERTGHRFTHKRYIPAVNAPKEEEAEM